MTNNTTPSRHLVVRTDYKVTLREILRFNQLKEHMNLEIHQTQPRVHLPIRITESLHRKFTQISDSTQIPKSRLTRIGLELLFHNIETNGITSVLNEHQGVY
jgi:hypothetical protein